VDFPAIGRALSDLGGFALFLATVVFGMVALWKRQVVMGWYAERLEARNATLEVQNERNIATIAQLTESNASLGRTVDSQQRTIDALAWRRRDDGGGPRAAAGR
jgi:cytoskeletal protein RodZ